MKELFQFNSASAFFNFIMEEKKRKNPAFSLRAAAAQIGTAPSTLSFFINGQKNLSSESGRKISRWLKLDEIEEDYFLKLVELQGSRDSKIKEKINLSLTKNQQTSEKRKKRADFEILNDWRNVALIAMFMCEEFRGRPVEEISSLLGEPKETVKRLLQNLTEQNVLEVRDGNVRHTASGLLFDSPGPQGNLRTFHKSMLLKAIEALETQTNREKFIGSETFGFDEENLPQARELMEDFLTKMTALSQKSKKKDIYHVGLQFFKVTHQSSVPKGNLS